VRLQCFRIVSGGREIQQECSDHVRQHGIVKPGQVYVSKSGSLPCKKVIHAVGPGWQGGFHNEEHELYHAVNESMKAAEQYGLTSIAFPALSTGILKFPVDKCTKIIATALKDFLDSQQQTCVKKVSLVHFHKLELKEFRKSLKILSGKCHWLGLGVFIGTNEHFLSSPYSLLLPCGRRPTQWVLLLFSLTLSTSF
jgi:poly [ADP-ribose] polymerase 10/14/15